MKLTTLCFLVSGGRALLAMKKRGFGEGKFNGVGGKVLAGESIVSAIIREAEEEISVKISAGDLKHKAKLNFSFEGKPEWNQECHVFVAEKWRGVPKETGEMRPQWFTIDALPFEKMWTDDFLWLPQVLEGKPLEADFFFNRDGTALRSYDVRLL